MECTSVGYRLTQGLVFGWGACSTGRGKGGNAFWNCSRSVQTSWPKSRIKGCKCFAGLKRDQPNISEVFLNKRKRILSRANAITGHISAVTDVSACSC